MKSFGFAVSLAACLAGVMESAAAQLDAEVKAPAFVKAKAFAWFDASDKDSFTLDASGKVAFDNVAIWPRVRAAVQFMSSSAYRDTAERGTVRFHVSL